MVRNVLGMLSSAVKRDRETDESVSAVCFVCASSLTDSGPFAHYRVCPTCRFHYSITARERIAILADPGAFRETNRAVTSVDPLSFSSRVPYKHRVFRDQRRTGLTEAVVTGSGAIGGNPVVLIVLDFGFMGGSMGCVVGEKVALAFEYAAKRDRPVVGVVTSGGARIQEGILSLMQMAKTTIAAGKLSAKGLPFITVLSNPATGQAYASFANLADVILAEPGAIVGFAPIRSIRERGTDPVPEGAQTAESHLSHGLLDGIVDRERLRERLSALLDLLGPQYTLAARRKRETLEPAAAPSAWDTVQLARHAGRPTARDYFDRILTNFVELRGDRLDSDDPSMVIGLGRLGGQTVVIIGQQRGGSGGDADGWTRPEGLRKAQRALRIALKFDLPVITLLDTRGIYTSLEAEQRGLGNTVAETMAQMAAVETPSLAVIIGEGGSEGALPLAVANRVLMMENAVYTVIAPEDAASLIYQDKTRAGDVAESLRLTAQDCKEMRIVDSVVQEPTGGAHVNPVEASNQLHAALLRELADLQSKSKRRLVEQRYKKFRKMGEYSSHFRASVDREVDYLQRLVATGVRRIARHGQRSPDSEPLSEAAPPTQDDR